MTTFWRGTEYGLEQVYNVIDSRYRSGRPLIVMAMSILLQSLNVSEEVLRQERAKSIAAVKRTNGQSALLLTNSRYFHRFCSLVCCYIRHGISLNIQFLLKS